MSPLADKALQGLGSLVVSVAMIPFIAAGAVVVGLAVLVIWALDELNDLRLLSPMVIGALLAIAVMTLTGCDYQPRTTATTLPVQEGEARFEIIRVADYYDDFAYENRRGVYIVRDRETGREFVGVSGIGITEIGDHDDGNDGRVEDER